MSSSQPVATPYFVTLATTALGDQATVYFGKPLPMFSAPITLQVIGVVGDQQPAELGPNYRREETFAIQCELTSFAGDEDFAARMQEAYDALALIEVAVGNDPTLGNTVRYAEIGSTVFTPDSNAPGKSIGQLAFDIRCSARINSLT